MSKKRILRFVNNPFRWIWSYLIFSNLPLMWQCKIAVKHLNWMKYKRHFKDDFFGEKKVIIYEVLVDWCVYTGNEGKIYRLRDVVYSYKREKIPFHYGRKLRGTQITDEHAFPMKLQSHQFIIEVLENTARAFFQMHQRNLQRDAILNPKFKEYDHDL